VIIFSNNFPVDVVNSTTASSCDGVMGNGHNCQIKYSPYLCIGFPDRILFYRLLMCGAVGNMVLYEVMGWVLKAIGFIPTSKFRTIPMP